jgi:hypothetical protein
MIQMQTVVEVFLMKIKPVGHLGERRNSWVEIFNDIQGGQNQLRGLKRVVSAQMMVE